MKSKRMTGINGITLMAVFAVAGMAFGQEPAAGDATSSPAVQVDEVPAERAAPLANDGAPTGADQLQRIPAQDLVSPEVLQEAETQQAEATAAAVSPNQASAPNAYDVGTGTRLTIGDKGFSIIAPKGWTLRQDYPGTSLLLEEPKKESSTYQSTIQVLVFSEPLPVDEQTATAYRDELAKRYSVNASDVTDYRLRNHEFVDLPDGSRGILYYADFKVTGIPLMHAHLLTSSATRHYLLTFTDLPEHFEGDAGRNHLGVAWEAVTSIQLDSQASGRFSTPVTVLGVMSLIAAVLFGFTMIRRRRASELYREALREGKLSDSLEVSRAPESLVVTGVEVTNLESLVTAPATSFTSKPESQLDSDVTDDGKSLMGKVAFFKRKPKKNQYELSINEEESSNAETKNEEELSAEAETMQDEEIGKAS